MSFDTSWYQKAGSQGDSGVGGPAASSSQEKLAQQNAQSAAAMAAGRI